MRRIRTGSWLLLALPGSFRLTPPEPLQEAHPGSSWLLLVWVYALYFFCVYCWFGCTQSIFCVFTGGLGVRNVFPVYLLLVWVCALLQAAPGGARGPWGEPGGARGEPGGSQGEPGGARRSQEEPGGARGQEPGAPRRLHVGDPGRSRVLQQVHTSTTTSTTSTTSTPCFCSEPTLAWSPPSRWETPKAL